MKKILLTINLIAVFSFFSAVSFAQAEAETTATQAPKWVSENGYWVIESNINTPKLNTVYFYNNSNVLVYKEKVDGVVLNIKKRRVKMNLRKVLDQAIIAFNTKQKAAENEMLVMNLIKR